MTETLTLYDGQCCTRWPLLFGLKPRGCGICGEVPAPIPGTYRTVEVEPSQHAPKVVATVKRSPEEAS